MEKQPCSIFNDVIGPVMRGPSSSHVAGAARIADLVRQAMPGKITHVLCDFDPTGALAASHTGHGTDMGFACGLLGIPLSNPQVDRYEELAKEAGLSIEYHILEYGAVHPGNYRIQAIDDRGNCRHFEAVALGGGMIEMQKYEGHPVQVGGDYYEVLILSEAGLEEKKFSRPRTESELQAYRETAGVKEVIYLKPVLPTLSGENVEVPYRTAAELLAYAEEHLMEPWEYAAYYESCRGGKTVEEVFRQMEDVLDVMEAAVENGLAGTQYEDRILGAQSPLVAKAEKAGRLLRMPAGNDYRAGEGTGILSRGLREGFVGGRTDRRVLRGAGHVFSGSRRMPGRMWGRVGSGGGGHRSARGGHDSGMCGCRLRGASEHHGPGLRSGGEPRGGSLSGQKHHGGKQCHRQRQYDSIGIRQSRAVGRDRSGHLRHRIVPSAGTSVHLRRSGKNQNRAAPLEKNEQIM